jgi:hypothetical protein
MSNEGQPDPDLDKTEPGQEETDISMDAREQEELLRDSGEEAEEGEQKEAGDPDPALKEGGIANKSSKNKKINDLEGLKSLSKSFESVVSIGRENEGDDDVFTTNNSTGKKKAGEPSKKSNAPPPSPPPPGKIPDPQEKRLYWY